MEKSSTPAISAARQTANWAQDIVRRPLSAEITSRVKSILLDALSCALAGRTDPTTRTAINVIRTLGGAPACTVIGYGLRTAAPFAAFANGVLMRAIEFNDSYAGPGQIGHPSDNISAILALAEIHDRSGLEVLQTIYLGYELYGRMLDLSEPNGAWDHTSVSGVVCAIEAGLLMRQPADILSQAISLAAIHSASSREVRSGHISAAKSTAGAMMAQLGVQSALFAAAGLDGPQRSLEGTNGFARQVLNSSDCTPIWNGVGRERIFSVSLKAYPCFALAQGSVAASIDLRKTIDPQSIENLSLYFANCRPVSLRIPERSNWSPDSREAADHSLPYLTAVAWLDGRIDLAQFENQRWRDPEVKSLMDRIELHIDPKLPMAAPGAYTFRLELTLQDGSRRIENHPVCPGHPDNPLSWADLKDKFRACAAPVIQHSSCEQIIDMVETLEDQKSIRPMLDLLSASDPR